MNDAPEQRITTAPRATPGQLEAEWWDRAWNRIEALAALGALATGAVGILASLDPPRGHGSLSSLYLLAGAVALTGLLVSRAIARRS